MLALLKRHLRTLIYLGVIGLVVAIAAGLGAAYWVPLPARLKTRDSTVVAWKDGQAAHVMLSADDKQRIPVDLERVDPAYVRALVALEDERFWSHPGVDPVAIGRAALSNARHGEVVSGGSTITMQLVRLLEPRPRTLRSKMVEALRAVQLEMRMSKEEILEAYLRFVPYGGNVEGVESASLAYFGQPAKTLSDAQICTLLAVPQNPTLHHPSPQNARRLEKTRNKIARKLLRDGALRRQWKKGSEGKKTAAKPRKFGRAFRRIAAEPVPTFMKPLPRRLPHLAYWLRAKYPDELRFRTTLDRHTQRTVEKLVAARRAVAERHGIFNTAVVVAEHDTGAVRAVVGNFDFDDAAHAGQIPGFDKPRSTGSLLKPFLYAQGIDDGLVAPEFLVPDIPTSYGNYSPENYKHRYAGLVRMKDALARSLNIPFINLLNQVGVDRFQSTLRELGLRRLNPEPGDSGLSIAVGGVEASPVEVAALYAALANEARPTPLRFLARVATPGGDEAAGRDGSEQAESEKTASAQPAVFSPGAAWLTRRALRRRDRPDFPARKFAGARANAIHWKTGTSSGYRDAWTAGSAGKYTAVVWMGNFSREPSSYLVGAKAAAPLFFDILEAVDDPDTLDDARPDEAMTEVEVCAFSGHLPTEACEHTETVHLPTESVPTERCQYHVEVDVDTTTGRALNTECRQNHDYTTESFVRLPAEVRQYMRERLGDVSEPPELAPDCSPTSSVAPAIASPPRGQTLVLMPGVPKQRQKVMLRAAAADATSALAWFVDGEFLGKTKADDSLWWTPSHGEHQIVVMNDAAQAARRRLVVR